MVPTELPTLIWIHKLKTQDPKSLIQQLLYSHQRKNSHVTLWQVSCDCHPRFTCWSHSGMDSNLGQRWRGLKVCNERGSVESLTHVMWYVCYVCLWFQVFLDYSFVNIHCIWFISSLRFVVCVAGSQAFPTLVFSGKWLDTGFPQARHLVKLNQGAFVGSHPWGSKARCCVTWATECIRFPLVYSAMSMRSQMFLLL